MLPQPRSTLESPAVRYGVEGQEGNSTLFRNARHLRFVPLADRKATRDPHSAGDETSVGVQKQAAGAISGY